MADEVLEVEMDGVPILWVPSDSRDLTGGIIVRVGLSDESFVRRGFTHLIEHLALSMLNVDYDYNGFVDSTTTNFIARGSPDDVLHFMESTLAALTELPYDRLDVERRVLLAESERNGVSSSASALAVLFGANGVGSMALPEMGLWQATPETLDGWLADWFTRQNMVVWFAGPEPLRFSVDGFRDGVPRPTVMMERRPSSGPGIFVDAVPGPGLVNAVSRSPLVGAGLAMVTDRLTDRLRTNEGMSYSVNSSVQPLNASATLLTLAADCRADDVDDVFAIMVMELNRFAFEGPCANEVADYLRKRRRLIGGDGAPVAKASTAAYHRLQGAPTIDPVDELAKVEAATPSMIAAAMEDIIGSAIWIVPPGATVRDQRFTPVRGYTAPAPAGSAYPSTVSDTELVIDGVTIGLTDQSSGLAIVMDVQDIIGAVAYQDGAHTFYRRDAVSATIQPADHPGCEPAYREFLARVPDAMTVAVPRPLRSDADRAEIDRRLGPSSPVGRTIAAFKGRFRSGGR